MGRVVWCGGEGREGGREGVMRRNGGMKRSGFGRCLYFLDDGGGCSLVLSVNRRRVVEVASERTPSCYD